MNINPIEKHKEEIVKSINKLQQKFQEKQIKIPSKSIKDRINQNKPIISKTVQIRNRPKVPGQISKGIRQTNDYLVKFYDPLGEIPTYNNNQTDRKEKEKQDKFKQLYQMMKSILEGQKNIEKQINLLKQQNIKNNQIKIKANFAEVKNNNAYEHVNTSFLKLENKQKVIQKPQQIITQKQTSLNNTIQAKQFNKQRNQSSSKIKKNKNVRKYNIDDKLLQMKKYEKNHNREIVKKQQKQQIWQQIQKRIKQSQKQYCQSHHRNNKHQFQHLVSTYQLQGKLKQDLIQKVYSQCDHLFYK